MTNFDINGKEALCILKLKNVYRREEAQTSCLKQIFKNERLTVEERDIEIKKTTNMKYKDMDDY